MMATRPPSGDEFDGVEPTQADDVAHPEQPPMDDDASGLPDEDAEQLGDFA